MIFKSLERIKYEIKSLEPLKPEKVPRNNKPSFFRASRCVKSVQILGFSGLFFPAFRLNMEFTSKISVFSPNTGKYGLEKTPYLDTFHAVSDPLI